MAVVDVMFLDNGVRRLFCVNWNWNWHLQLDRTKDIEHYGHNGVSSGVDTQIQGRSLE